MSIFGDNPKKHWPHILWRYFFPRYCKCGQKLAWFDNYINCHFCRVRPFNG